MSELEFFSMIFNNFNELVIHFFSFMITFRLGKLHTLMIKSYQRIVKISKGVANNID